MADEIKVPGMGSDDDSGIVTEPEEKEGEVGTEVTETESDEEVSE